MCGVHEPGLNIGNTEKPGIEALELVQQRLRRDVARIVDLPSREPGALLGSLVGPRQTVSSGRHIVPEFVETRGPRNPQRHTHNRNIFSTQFSTLLDALMIRHVA